MALSQDPGEEPDFQRLQDQAGAELQDLVTLSPELQDALLGAFRKLLQDRSAQQELEDMLEQALDSGLLGQLDGPGALVLSILRRPSDSVSSSRGRAILYILGALAALSDQHHCLLAESLERGILSQELDLVTSILEPNCKQMQEADVTLPTKALCALQSEDVALALSLVQSCGLELQEASCRLTWDPTVVPQLFALYGCLTGLWLLAKSKPGPSGTLSKETLSCP